MYIRNATLLAASAGSVLLGVFLAPGWFAVAVVFLLFLRGEPASGHGDDPEPANTDFNGSPIYDGFGLNIYREPKN